jgi:hypothetical protein
MPELKKFRHEEVDVECGASNRTTRIIVVTNKVRDLIVDEYKAALDHIRH